MISISLIIGVAALLTIIGRIIKQPPIISYLIAGIIVGPIFLGLIGPGTTSSELIQIFAHLGVVLLLFIVGLSLDFRVLKDVGGVASLAGIGEIIVTSAIGFLIAYGLGFGSIGALYIAVALAFSSTVVVVKILSDKKEMDTLHGKIAIGILIVQDFVAALALMIAPLVQGNAGINTIVFQLLYIIALTAVIFLFSALVLKKTMHRLATSQEVLFLFGVSWALIISSLFSYLGFSLEIGALIAGMALATSEYTLELGGKIKPLRDFFVILFFVFFGSQLLAENVTAALIGKAVIFSAFVLLGKPLIVMSFMSFLGYKKRVNFLTGLSLAQISEFSLILVLLGFTLGHLTQEVMGLIIMVSLITIGVSSYSMYYSHSIFNRISGMLNIFEKRKTRAEKEKKEKDYEVIVFGYNRIGYNLLKTLKKLKVKFLVIDYNPKVIMDLSKNGVNAIYGDANDKEFLDEIRLDQAKMVISTIPELDSNLLIQETLRREKSKTIFIGTTLSPHEALDLYRFGADYVIVPTMLGGEYISKMIEHNKTDKSFYKRKGKEQIKYIKEREKDKMS